MELQVGYILSGNLIFSIVLAISAFTNNTDQQTENDRLSNASYGERVDNCRLRHIEPLNESMFEWKSCFKCASYMPKEYFYPNKQPYLVNCTDVNFGYSNKTYRENIEATINSFKGRQLWRECCRSAIKCYQKMETDPEMYKGEPHCRRQWDGWQCIPDTPTNEAVKVVCPSYIYFFGEPPASECSNFASKACYGNGKWSEKTDYTSCGQADSLKRRMYVNIGAFAFSLVFLIPAVIIFTVYRQLRVPRVAMHTNLFLALIINGIVVIVYKSVLSLNVLEEGSIVGGIVERNSDECKLALVLTKYTRMTTYMWMLCEGFYLHKLIVTAFAEEKRLIFYYLIGWVFPIIPVAIYALMRKTYADKQCWMIPEGGFEWIINAPMLLSLALNLIFLCNIIRVLITKLQATHSNEPSQYRKAVRATVVLVPLFGLHFLLTIYLPNYRTCGPVEFYYYFSYLIDGLQGFIVSLIFCYLNGEVLHLLKRSYQRHREMMNPTGRYSRTSASTQMMSITEMPSTSRKHSFGSEHNGNRKN